MLAKEITRQKRVHGPGSITFPLSSHHQWGNVGYYLSALTRFANLIGFTRVAANPDSWEGWYWGAMHHFGNSMRIGVPSGYGGVEDCLQEAEMIVFWSCGPESTNGAYAGFEGRRGACGRRSPAWSSFIPDDCLVRACLHDVFPASRLVRVDNDDAVDAHLLDQGWPQPRCQQSCPTDVFETVKLDDAAMDEKARREGLKGLRPNLGTKPRFWYSGLERWESCFIGGSVSARMGDVIECVTDAAVTLYVGNQKQAETVADGFGDFRFSGLAKGSGIYRVEIRHDLGNASRECELGESVYLGEVSLARPTSGSQVART